MAKTSRGRSQDRSKVAGGQDYELEYEKQKTGSSKKQIKSAIKAVGNQRQQVEKKLQKSKWLARVGWNRFRFVIRMIILNSKER